MLRFLSYMIVSSFLCCLIIYFTPFPEINYAAMQEFRTDPKFVKWFFSEDGTSWLNMGILCTAKLLCRASVMFVCVVGINRLFFGDGDF